MVGLVKAAISWRVLTGQPTYWTLLAIPDLDATLANGIVILPQRDNLIAAL
jgi:hypothetical protein